jgi:hypothetical protein
MARELVTIEEAAQRLKYSISYFRNNWFKLLPGVRPVKLGPNRAVRFLWDEIEKLLLQPK